MAGPNDFTGLNIQDTYQRVLQASSSGQITDGTGSLIQLLEVTASYAVSASHEITHEISSSYAQTASFAEKTKGDLTISTGLDLSNGAVNFTGEFDRTLTLDLTEVITNDGANKLLTTDGDGTLTAETHFTVNNTEATLNGNLIVSTSIETPVLKGDGTLATGLVIEGYLQTEGLSGHITSSGNISASGYGHFANLQVPATGKIRFDDVIGSDDQYIQGNENNITVDGDQFVKLIANDSIEVGIATNDIKLTIDASEGHITASGNISSSGNLTISESLTFGGTDVRIDFGEKLTIGNSSENDYIKIVDEQIKFSVNNSDAVIINDGSNVISLGYSGIDEVVIGAHNNSAVKHNFATSNEPLHSQFGQTKMGKSGNLGVSTTATLFITGSGYADYVGTALEVEGNTISSGSLELIGNITASGEVSASGEVLAHGFKSQGNYAAIWNGSTMVMGTYQQPASIRSSNLELNQGDLTLTHATNGHITASGNISASGNITVNNITVNEITASGNVLSLSAVQSPHYNSTTSGTGYKLSGAKVIHTQTSSVLPSSTVFGRDTAVVISGSSISLGNIGDTNTHVTTSGNITASGIVEASGYRGTPIHLAHASQYIAATVANQYYFGNDTQGFFHHSHAGKEPVDSFANATSSNNTGHKLGQGSQHNAILLPCGVKDIELRASARTNHAENATSGTDAEGYTSSIANFAFWVMKSRRASQQHSNPELIFLASASAEQTIQDGQHNRFHTADITGNHSFRANMTASVDEQLVVFFQPYYTETDVKTKYYWTLSARTNE